MYLIHDYRCIALYKHHHHASSALTQSPPAADSKRTRERRRQMCNRCAQSLQSHCNDGPFVYPHCGRAVKQLLCVYCCCRWSWKPAAFSTQSLLICILNIVLSMRLLQRLQWWLILNRLSATSIYRFRTFQHMLACSCAKTIPYVQGQKLLLYDSGQ